MPFHLDFVYGFVRPTRRLNGLLWRSILLRSTCKIKKRKPHKTWLGALKGERRTTIANATFYEIVYLLLYLSIIVYLSSGLAIDAANTKRLSVTVIAPEKRK